MATQPLSSGTTLLPGQGYTFVFTPGGINVFVTADQMTGDLQSLDYLDSASAYFVGNGLGPVYIRFTYGGDGTDTVDSVSSDIINTIQNNHTLFYLTLSYATLGIVSAPTVSQQISPFVPSTSTLLIIVAGIALVVFALSGGAGIVRRATA